MQLHTAALQSLICNREPNPHSRQIPQPGQHERTFYVFHIVVVLLGWLHGEVEEELLSSEVGSDAAACCLLSTPRYVLCFQAGRVR